MDGPVNVPGAIGAELAAVRSLAQTANDNANAALAAITNLTSTIEATPSQSGTLTYTGSEQSPAWSNYDSNKLTIGGTTKGTNAGSYNATFTPKEGYKWSDGTTTARTVIWTIGRAAGIVVPSQSGSLTYTGSAQSPQWKNYDSNKLTIGGTSSATDAGNYETTFTPTSNYQWGDGTTNTRTVVWTIGKASLTVPSQSGSLTYTGSAQSPQWSNYDSNKLTIGGTYSATNAGTYTATFTPNSNHQWSDGTTTAKSVNWTIGKAAGSLSLGASSVTLDVSTPTESVAVTRAGDGAISATSSNTSVAKVEVDGTNVKITGLATGDATITVSVAAGTNHTAPSNKTITVTASVPDSTLANNTPEIIQATAQSGQAANYWSVGDKVGIALSGTVGALTLNGTYYAFILGFNHNSSVEGGNSIHFQFGKTSDDVDIAFVDSDYDNTGSSAGFRMNTSETNSGGWKSSYMRNTICPAFLKAMPAAWQNIIAACTKYSDNTGGGSDEASAVTSTSDQIWLLAEFEVFGERSFANAAEQNYQKQYDYYANGNSPAKYQHNATSTNCDWLLRSPSMIGDGCISAIGINKISSSDANTSHAFAPGFMVA